MQDGFSEDWGHTAIHPRIEEMYFWPLRFLSSTHKAVPLIDAFGGINWENLRGELANMSTCSP